LKEVLVNWFQQVLKVDRFEATHEISRVCVLVHIENVKFLANYFRNFLNSCRFTCSSFTNQ